MSKRTLQRFLEEADIRINGDRPWDLQVRDDRLWRRAALTGSIGFGDAYVDGWWDAEEVDSLVDRLVRAHHNRRPGGFCVRLVARLQHGVMNLQSVSRAFQVGERHYDIGNELYRRMLDPGMNYSCGYWRDANTLADAQTAKLDLVCRKLGLKPGMRVLDIGCGWGGLCEHAAREYGVEVVGLTVSREQQAFARERCRDLPVEIRLEDYRACADTFDRIASIGMFEHVGLKNYPVYFESVRRCLKPDGLCLVHTIGAPETVTASRNWHTERIFPNGFLPSIVQISRAAERRLVTEDLHNFGADYDPTLMAWWRNVSDAWSGLNAMHPDKYTDRFRRRWEYYLRSCAGAFRARHLQIWQWVFSPQGVPGGYRRP